MNPPRLWAVDHRGYGGVEEGFTEYETEAAARAKILECHDSALPCELVTREVTAWRVVETGTPNGAA